MIKRENSIKVEKISEEFIMDIDGRRDLFKEAIFFDLEHYLYKKPICIGVFGCCYYDSVDNEIKVTQYMIEGKKDAVPILELAKEYFIEMHEKHGKKYIVTFSGNNDFTVIDYLFDKNKTDFNIDDCYEKIDLQREYEKLMGVNIGLKNLEKIFGIEREGELISGSNLSKTFCKVMKDFDYMNRMPEEKKQRILLYNEQDVVSLFQIYVEWKKFLKKEEN
ncbi:ribonuclease H-like domain-containing protein [Clostridium sp. ZS2-4]|uniref:ribonuclease H-like domain-containing protein n=1 Tax=Clostridium sp. ZS2-4 TaxID=2987703 RepID=UPI00227C06D9|nr:ribonuclease H-like domain-containing protein [Clostridium sp. ZS2-4]MCY6355054.1 ribonuclease H-like domain-containing protein [Clostridium sp. ZS2-4]